MAMDKKEREAILIKSKNFFKNKIVKSHIKNTEKLSSIDEFKINPFMHTYLAQFAFGNSNCSDPIKLDLVIRVVIYCPDIFMPRNACAYTV